MAELKLRNCPFCGSEENAIKEHWMCRNMWYVQCYGCGCNTACFRTKEEAAEAWNTRYLTEYNVEMKDSWIPCSERMPENRCGVIFTVNRAHPFVCVGYRINSEREGLKLQRWFDKLSGLNFSDYDVKAWMPMPDAYEPHEKEDET